jgi:hypothetical protein
MGSLINNHDPIKWRELVNALPEYEAAYNNLDHRAVKPGDAQSYAQALKIVKEVVALWNQGEQQASAGAN